jgi:hypothetical protein
MGSSEGELPTGRDRNGIAHCSSKRGRNAHLRNDAVFLTELHADEQCCASERGEQDDQ